jgi:hypothetical protein
VQVAVQCIKAKSSMSIKCSASPTFAAGVNRNCLISNTILSVVRTCSVSFTSRTFVEFTCVKHLESAKVNLVKNGDPVVPSN